MKTWLQNVLEAISQLINATIGGDADEMLSSRSWRCQWRVMIYILDRVLGEGHCEASWRWEREHYAVERFGMTGLSREVSDGQYAG